MAKILVIGIGGSQAKVVEKLQQLIPNSRCVHIDTHLLSQNSNIEYFSLIKNSKIAKEIINLGCMPGSTHAMIVERLPEIIEEQREKLINFLGF